ncbi:hypothetical protein Sjap_014690 [Stephania japonica]|uniref:Chlororespiratory reduction 21 n=1 Tax=Stephania japonica TaxID=461633 RepID=A0AAP0IIT7_9MAGN
MYVKCGSFTAALQVFDEIISKSSNDNGSEFLVQDVTLWNSIINGYFRYGHMSNGFAQFRRMLSLGVAPDGHSLSIILGACSEVSCVEEGKQIHGYIVRRMFYGDAFLETALIHLYAKCARVASAWVVFDKFEDKQSNVAVWNAMIGGFCENGQFERGLELFTLMKNEQYQLGSATFSSVLTVVSENKDLDFGCGVHCEVIKRGLEHDPYVCTSLLNMYARCSLVQEAYKIFDGVSESRRKIELWNVLIAAYVSNNCAHEALGFYRAMRSSGFGPDFYTISNILSACSKITSHDIGRQVHAEVIKRPLQSEKAVKTALVIMYAKCGYVEFAYPIFCAINEKDIVCWGSMISGFCINNKFEEALHLFKEMNVGGVKSDSSVMASVIAACGALEYAHFGFAVHGYVIKNGTSSHVFVDSSLIDLYAKLGMLDMAEIVFSNMPRDCLVAWNSIISCYNRNGLPELSVSLLPKIVHYGLVLDSVTITNALVAISSMAALLKGKSLHCYQIKHEIQSDLRVHNTLINMYIKCGCFGYAQRIFRNMVQRNIVTWNSMIAGYGSHGDGVKAIRTFDNMKQLEEIPDEITFLLLISACSYSGLTEEGISLFNLMRKEYKIEPRMEHCVNMVDLLGRAGRLSEAYAFVDNMPIKPNKNIWLSMLSACRIHKNIALGELSARNLLEMEPTRGSNYVQLVNLYAEEGLWEKAANMRTTMRAKGLKKNPGCSWIEMKDRHNVFFSGDSSSYLTLEIYETLNSLMGIMELDEELMNL